MSDVNIQELTEAIRDASISRIPVEVALWDRAAIAEFLCYSKKVVSDSIVNQPEFPKRVDIGTGRWKAKEVIEWAYSQQNKAKVGRPRKYG